MSFLTTLRKHFKTQQKILEHHSKAAKPTLFQFSITTQELETGGKEKAKEIISPSICDACKWAEGSCLLASIEAIKQRLGIHRPLLTSMANYFQWCFFILPAVPNTEVLTKTTHNFAGCLSESFTVDRCFLDSHKQYSKVDLQTKKKMTT